MKDEINNMHDLEKIIWTDGPSSKLKNKYCVEMLRHLGEKYNKLPLLTFLLLLTLREVLGRVGGTCKSTAQPKTMSKRTDHIIVQNTKEFAEAAAHLVPSTHVIFIQQSKTDEEINMKNPFQRIIFSNGIFTMHVIKCSYQMVKLWGNLQYVNHQPDISMLDFQSRGPVFKTTGCLQGRLSLLSFPG